MTLVRRIDAVTLLRRDAVQHTAEGFRLFDALFARTGIQEYSDGAGGIIREYRPPEEVFHPDALASYELRPLTDLHPPANVTGQTARTLARGAVSPGRRAEDGIHVAGRLAVWDDTLQIDQLSAGYTLDLEVVSGTTPDGQRFDAVQRNIRINHVAAVPLGRAGTARVLTDAADMVGAWDLGFAKSLADVAPHRSQRVIVDMGRWSRRDAADLRTQRADQPPPGDKTMKKIKIQIDGKPVEIEVADNATTEQIAAAGAKAHADALPPEFLKKKKTAAEESEEDPEEEEEMADKKPKAKADTNLDALVASKVAEAEARADARAESRLDALSTARAVLGLDYTADGKSVDAMRLDVIEAVLGKDERIEIEKLPKADQSGAIAFAVRKAVRAHGNRDHAGSLLAEINRSRGSEKTDGKPEVDSYQKQRDDAAREAALTPEQRRAAQKAS